MAARFSKTASNGSIRTRKTRPSENAFSSTPRPLSTCSRNIPRLRPGWRLAKTSCSRSTTPFMKSPNNTMKKTVTFLTLAMAIGWSQIVNAKTKTSEAKPRIEVCFVLDTTGSMGGLIEGAKQKIWSIANEMISAKPTPELKLGLIGYRDRSIGRRRHDREADGRQAGAVKQEDRRYTDSIWQCRVAARSSRQTSFRGKRAGQCRRRSPEL